MTDPLVGVLGALADTLRQALAARGGRIVWEDG